MKSSWLSLFVLALVSLVACTSPVPPTVTRPYAGTFDKEPVLFLIAERQRERIAQSLTDAGFTLSPESAAPYHLRVRVGSGRTSNDCGSMGNVAYEVLIGGRLAMQTKARGHTGSCEPNVFDDLSRNLATHFEQLQGASGPADQPQE